MRKTWVIAVREYLAAVRTKTFVISLVIMPVLMAGSILVQWLVRDLRDTADKKFVLIDRAGKRELVERIHAAVQGYNQVAIFDKDRKQQIKPRFVLEFPCNAHRPEEVDQERFELSERIRAGELVGFLEILLPDAKSKAKGAKVILRYQSNNPTYLDFSKFVEVMATEYLRQELRETVPQLKDDVVKALLHPVELESKGLSRRDPATGLVAEATEASRFAPVIVPFVLMMLMFMVVLMTATPLMQGVVEEKMQRIAEVLLGSVGPFALMMGKLIGMTGVSLTIALVYLGGAYWSAHYFGFADSLSVDLLGWFLLFQILAGLMFGALFIAVGSACTELKETQNMLWPVMLLACLPMFFIGPMLHEPNSPLVRGLSFFPFFTPTLMIARQAIPPGLPWWEPLLGIVLVLATTLGCVWAAGRIFRVGLLLQGKGAKLREMVKWVLRG